MQRAQFFAAVDRRIASILMNPNLFRGNRMATPQDYKHHTRFDPLFHFTIVPLLLINFAFSIVYCVHHYRQHVHLAPWAIVMSIVAILMVFLTRGYSLKVQDRVIRLEEKLRLASLVSASEQVELESLTIRQYVALRFASNAELPALARRAVREKLDGKSIKQSIVAWRADDYRV
jgi:hypothetical protein